MTTTTNAAGITLLQAQENLAELATVIRLSASNDCNGNPRRVYVAMVGGYFIGAWDEGYDGYRSVPAFLLDKAKYCLTFSVTVDEYTRQLSWAEELQSGYLQRIAKEAS